MSKNKMKIWLPLFVICLVVISMNFWAQQVCTEIFNTFTENFDDTEFKDEKNTTVIDWPSGPISLPFLGGNFAVMEPSGMGAKMYVTDAGDFNGDGYPDLIGLDIANRLEANPDAFLMAVAVAASCAFLTPIGHKNNTIIMGPGGYKFGDYWRWHKGRYRYRNRVPWAIAAIFEKHGFIWGAKWYHYDTLHFEYRPELLKEETDTVNADAPVPLPEKQPRKLD